METCGKRALGKPRRRWENNIKMCLHNAGRGGMAGLIWPRIGTDGGCL